jgi:hypothetical protein
MGEVMPSIPWTAPGLRITRLALHRPAGAREWQVRGCTGVLSGAQVRVALPFASLPIYGTTSVILKYAKRAKFDPRPTGILGAMKIWEEDEP